MRVLNVHKRKLRASREAVGALIDSLSSPADALWPRHCWPRMALDRPLGVRASGGHGPIRYVVAAYTPGQSVRFRFTGPSGFEGSHGFDIVEAGEAGVVLRHTVEMETRGPALVSWPLVFEPLHDALLEDCLSTAEVSLGQPSRLRAWSPWVRLLRWALSGGKAGAQVAPGHGLQETPLGKGG